MCFGKEEELIELIMVSKESGEKVEGSDGC